MVKTVLRYSWIYNKQFNPEYTKEDLKKLKEKCWRFERLYEEKIEKILKLIEKETGEWERKFIPIYIIENHKSFSDPLTLKYRNDEKLMIVVLIHELLHNNVKKRFKDSKSLHHYMKPILRRIITKLDENLIPTLEKEESFRRQNDRQIGT
jgi:hypothetical protein